MQEHVRDGIPMSGRTSDYRAWAAAIGKNVGITARTIREKLTAGAFGFGFLLALMLGKR
jgi:hypothetical protein